MHAGYRLPVAGVHTLYLAYTKLDDRRGSNADVASYGAVFTYALSKRTDINLVLTHFENKNLAQAAPGQAGFLGGVTAQRGCRLQQHRDRRATPVLTQPRRRTVELTAAGAHWPALADRCTLRQPRRDMTLQSAGTTPPPGAAMSNHVYKILELVGSSTSGSDDAIRQALETASKTVRNIDWFEVVETRGHVVDGKVGHFQVTLKVGFRLDA